MKKTYLIIVFLACQLFFLFNLQFTAWPEMLSYPYLRNHDFLLYKDMIHPYPPLLTMFLSTIYKVFGYDLLTLKIITWVISITNSVLIYILIRKLTKQENLSIFGLGIYAFLQPFLEGNMLWFDLAIVPTLLAGIYFILNVLEHKKITQNILLAGTFFAIAALTKQTTGLFIVVTALYLIWRKISLKEVAIFLLPGLIMGTLLVMRLLQEGSLNDFFLWTLIYPATEWAKYPGYVQMQLSGHNIAILSIFFIPVLFLLVKNRLFLKDNYLQLLLVFLVLSLILIYPRFSFFHFQAALAFWVITIFYFLKRFTMSKIIFLFIILFLLLTPLIYKPVLASSWNKEARFYGQEDIKLAQDIDNNCLSGRIYLFGLPAGLYVLSGHIPQERWADNFSWYLEIPGVQEEIINRWVLNPAECVYWRKPGKGNWFDLGVYQPKKIVDYIHDNYMLEKEIKPGIALWRRKS